MNVYLKRGLTLPFVLVCATIPYSVQAQDPNSHLYIAHAAAGRDVSSTTDPDYPVDLSIGGHCVAQGVAFGEIRGPVTVPAGSYTIKVSVADALNPCGGTVAFSPTVTLSAGTTSLGIVTLDSSHQVSGKIYTVDLSAVPAGEGRIIVANTTTANLTGTITVGDTDSSPESRAFAAGSVTEVSVNRGEYTANIYAEGSSSVAAGPVELTIDAGSVYLVVLGGATTNDSVQFIGPRVIRDVL